MNNKIKLFETKMKKKSKIINKYIVLTLIITYIKKK